MKPKDVLESKEQPMVQPPSIVLKNYFLSLKGSEPEERMISEVAKKTLLSPDEVKLWLDHLKTVETNRKRGAAKAAQTRRNKRQAKHAGDTEYKCGLCGAVYEDETEEEELWIECESCTQWFHAECSGVDPDSVPDAFVCSACQ